MSNARSIKAMKHLISRKIDNGEDGKFYEMQTKALDKVIEDTCKRKLAIDVQWSCNGSHYFLGVPLRHTESVHLDLEYVEAFDRKKHLCTTEEDNYRSLKEWVHSAFYTGAEWKIKRYETLTDEAFEVSNQCLI